MLVRQGVNLALTDYVALPDLQQLAIAYARPEHRGIWQVLLALDAHLAKLVSKAGEPLLGQVRLAWWRDRLQEEPSRWPPGNPLLAALNGFWGDDAFKLAALVDGWEHALAKAPITREHIEGFANGRGKTMEAVAVLLGTGASQDVTRAGVRWALADLLAHSVDMLERALMLEIAGDIDPTPPDAAAFVTPARHP